MNMANTKEQEAADAPEIIRLVNAHDTNGVEKLLITGAASVHDTDSTGMTPLMHAAFKGFTDMCKMLITQGSDVNADSHSHSYSPLHFAALSSNLDTTQLLLDAGAKTYKTNSLGRTAAQMAGFVGHSASVAIINNHVDKSELKKFTKPSSEHQKTTLNAAAEDELYSLIMQVNLSPVHLTLTVGRSPKLLENLADASSVLHHLSVAETKRTSNVNEVLSLKFHYLGYLLNYLNKELTKYREENESQPNSEPDTVPQFESFLKKLLKCTKEGDEVWQELWLRDAIKAFHCAEMPLFLQVVKSLAGKEILALSVLSGAINGQRGFAEENVCGTCGTNSKGMKACSRCHAVKYCNRYCQKLHWSSHKKFCLPTSKEDKKETELKSETENKENEETAAKN